MNEIWKYHPDNVNSCHSIAAVDLSAVSIWQFSCVERQNHRIINLYKKHLSIFIIRFVVVVFVC